jgi:hypothetical protein
MGNMNVAGLFFSIYQQNNRPNQWGFAAMLAITYKSKERLHILR